MKIWKRDFVYTVRAIYTNYRYKYILCWLPTHSALPVLLVLSDILDHSAFFGAASVPGWGETGGLFLKAFQSVAVKNQEIESFQAFQGSRCELQRWLSMGFPPGDKSTASFSPKVEDQIVRFSSAVWDTQTCRGILMFGLLSKKC